MSRQTVRLGFFIALCFATLSAFSAEARKVEEHTFPLESGGVITVEGNEGNITIKTWDNEEVHLKMTFRAWGRRQREAEEILDDFEVRIQEARDRLIIREEDQRHSRSVNFFDLFDEDFWQENGWRGVIVDYDLTVPKQVQLKLQNDEGDVEVSGTEGRIDISVDEGDVNLEGIVSEQIQVHVDEGDVSFYKVRDEGGGAWEVDADEGTIFVENADIVEMDLATDEGKIVIHDVRVSKFWLSTDEGDIDVDFQPRKNGNYRIEADEGDFEIAIPGDANLHVELRAEDGRIDSDFDLRIRERDDEESAEGVIGRNESTLRASTEEGDIVLIKQ